MASSFKTHSTPLSIKSDTIEVPEVVNLDSLKKLIPIGFYLLSEKGAKKALTADVNAKAYYEKWMLSDIALGNMANSLSLMTMQRNQAIDLGIRKEVVITALTKKLFWANFWKWTAITGSAALTTKMIFIK